MNPNTAMEYLAYHKLRKVELTHDLNGFYLLQYSLLNVYLAQKSCVVTMDKLPVGLFHHAISQSGSAINSWALDENPRKKAFILGEVLGCRTNDSKKLVEFLRTVSVRRLVENMVKIKEKEVKSCLCYVALQKQMTCDSKVIIPQSKEKYYLIIEEIST
jgi:carboxylesterase type B